MSNFEQRISALERCRPSPYPAGWPVLVADDLTDAHIETLKSKIRREDVFRESSPEWAHIFIG